MDDQIKSTILADSSEYSAFVPKYMETKPWDLAEDLSEEQLIEIAGFIAKVRGEVIELRNEELGDSLLVLGLRNYECCRVRLIREVKKETWPWLSILTAKGRFTFQIGNTPIRFVRNSPEELPDHKLITSVETNQQMSFLASVSEYSHLIWYFVFDTEADNPADTVYFVGYTDRNEIICQWKIPLEDHITLLHSINSVESEAKQLSPALVKPKKRKKEVEQNNEK